VSLILSVDDMKNHEILPAPVHRTSSPHLVDDGDLPQRSPLAARVRASASLRAALQRDVVAEVMEQIVFLRAHRDVTQSELARRLGVSQPVVAKLESGRGNPSAKTLKKIAEALDAVVRVDLIPEEYMDQPALRAARWWDLHNTAYQLSMTIIVTRPAVNRSPVWAQRRLEYSFEADQGPAHTAARYSSEGESDE
jgi:transcriptional regulator with XRE-family HTH domain